MAMEYVTISIFVLLIGFGVGLRGRAIGRRNARLVAIEEQFREIRHNNDSDPSLSFDGGTAVIVHDFIDPPLSQSKRALQELPSLHRIFRNAHGSYFLFISGDPPFIDHLTRERAMNAVRPDPVAFKHEFGEEPPA